jgi:8-oxo-dGTP diphosphatase
MRTLARAIIIDQERLLVIDRNRDGEPFLTLPGGGVEAGETLETAAVREVFEEASLAVAVDRLVYEEETERFGRQYYYLCTLIGSDAPAVHPGSGEAADNAAGRNTYEPVWLPLDGLAGANLLPPSVKTALLTDVAGGFPLQPKTLQYKV